MDYMDNGLKLIENTTAALLNKTGQNKDAKKKLLEKFGPLE